MNSYTSFTVTFTFPEQVSDEERKKKGNRGLGRE